MTAKDILRDIVEARRRMLGRQEQLLGEGAGSPDDVDEALILLRLAELDLLREEEAP